MSDNRMAAELHDMCDTAKEYARKVKRIILIETPYHIIFIHPDNRTTGYWMKNADGRIGTRGMPDDDLAVYERRVKL